MGAVADPDLGPVLAVGFGGGRAGLGRGLRSACCRSRTQKSTLIDLGDGVAAQLDGFRGSPLLDREALRELMLRFALLLREVPEVVVADLNPVRCMTSGCVVLDMRLRVERPARWSASRPGDEPWPGPTGASPARRNVPAGSTSNRSPTSDRRWRRAALSTAWPRSRRCPSTRLFCTNSLPTLISGCDLPADNPLS